MLKALKANGLIGGIVKQDTMFVCVEISDDKENTEGQRLALTEAQIREKTEKIEKLWRIPPTYALGVCDWLLFNALFFALVYVSVMAYGFFLDCYALLSDVLYQ